jgi:hypothetical protein
LARKDVGSYRAIYTEDDLKAKHVLGEERFISLIQSTQGHFLQSLIGASSNALHDGVVYASRFRVVVNHHGTAAALGKPSEIVPRIDHVN